MHRSKGFSLIEVLISIVVVAVGLLGMAGLSANSMKNTNTSLARSHATVLANDILERMRANIVRARGEQYDIAPGPAYTAAAGTLEFYDCNEWYDELLTAFPDGTGTVDVRNGVATIVITWGIDDDSFTTISQL